MHILGQFLGKRSKWALRRAGMKVECGFCGNGGEKRPAKANTIQRLAFVTGV
jgi:hypothetical protein